MFWTSLLLAVLIFANFDMSSMCDIKSYHLVRRAHVSELHELAKVHRMYKVTLKDGMFVYCNKAAEFGRLQLNKFEYQFS
jgi:hypothetical protein